MFILKYRAENFGGFSIRVHEIGASVTQIHVSNLKSAGTVETVEPLVQGGVPCFSSLGLCSHFIQA